MPPKGLGDCIVARIKEAIEEGQLNNSKSLRKYYKENQGQLYGIDFSTFERWVLHSTSD